MSLNKTSAQQRGHILRIILSVYFLWYYRNSTSFKEFRSKQRNFFHQIGVEVKQLHNHINNSTLKFSTLMPLELSVAENQSSFFFPLLFNTKGTFSSDKKEGKERERGS